MEEQTANFNNAAVNNSQISDSTTIIKKSSSLYNQLRRREVPHMDESYFSSNIPPIKDQSQLLKSQGKRENHNIKGQIKLQLQRCNLPQTRLYVTFAMLIVRNTLLTPFIYS